jgi:hypothetical protein
VHGSDRGAPYAPDPRQVQTGLVRWTSKPSAAPCPDRGATPAGTSCARVVESPTREQRDVVSELNMILKHWGPHVLCHHRTSAALPLVVEQPGRSAPDQSSRSNKHAEQEQMNPPLRFWPIIRSSPSSTTFKEFFDIYMYKRPMELENHVFVVSLRAALSFYARFAPRRDQRWRCKSHGTSQPTRPAA